MTVRRIDGDDISTSGTQFLTEREEVAQTISTRLNLFLGEYFRDINEGMPWFQSIIPKNTSLDTKEAIIKRHVLQTPDVVRWLEFQTDYSVDLRKYTVTGSVLTTFGQVLINERGFI